MRKQLTAIALFLQCFTAIGQADSSRDKHYMYSFITVNVGWGKNITAQTENIRQPFWATNGPTANISALFALKESYWGIAAQLGYSTTAFNTKAYYPASADTGIYVNNRVSVANVSAATYYNVYYLLGGLGIKLPQHTTQHAIEFRIMVGPMVCTMPALSYSEKINQAGVSTLYNVNSTRATAFSLAMSPGLGLGQKLTKHIAVMAYADILYSAMIFKTHNTISSPGYETTITTVNNHSLMEYGNITASVCYTFGKMTPNITY